MTEIRSITFEPEYRRDNGLAVVTTDALEKLAPFKVVFRSLVKLPEGQVAGNHKHPRTEAFFCTDEGAELHWIDIDGVQQSRVMADNGEMSIFVVPPHVPHAILNTSDHDITIFELADDAQHDVEAVKII